MNTRLQCSITKTGGAEGNRNDRRWSSLDSLKAIIYSLKEYGSGASHFDQDPTFDRFAYTIVSRDDWNPQPINQHRSTNKITNITQRPNKSGTGLDEFFT